MTVDDLFFPSMNATMTNTFVTVIQVKLVCFNVPLMHFMYLYALPHSPHCRAQNALISIQTLFFPNVGIVFSLSKM